MATTSRRAGLSDHEQYHGAVRRTGRSSRSEPPAPPPDEPSTAASRGCGRDVAAAGEQRREEEQGAPERRERALAPPRWPEGGMPITKCDLTACMRRR